jgi:hypothetical protein
MRPYAELRRQTNLEVDSKQRNRAFPQKDLTYRQRLLSGCPYAKRKPDTSICHSKRRSTIDPHATPLLEAPYYFCWRDSSEPVGLRNENHLNSFRLYKPDEVLRTEPQCSGCKNGHKLLSGVQLSRSALAKAEPSVRHSPSNAASSIADEYPAGTPSSP